jgi:hypothetical protein
MHLFQNTFLHSLSFAIYYTQNGVGIEDECRKTLSDKVSREMRLFQNVFFFATSFR